MSTVQRTEERPADGQSVELDVIQPNSEQGGDTVATPETDTPQI